MPRRPVLSGPGHSVDPAAVSARRAGSRGVARVLQLLPTPLAAPTHRTVLNWLYRYGLYVLNRAVERGTDWIWIADHTIAIGPLKCLVILGIPASALAAIRDRPSYRDL